MPEALKTVFLGHFTDITSPAGYLNGRLFATTIPVLMLVFTIGGHARDRRRGGGAHARPPAVDAD